MKRANCVLTAGTIIAASISLLGRLPAQGADTPRKLANDPPRLSPAERLVREALSAELSGDNARRDELLAQALKDDPNCRLARWQSAVVSLDNHWLTPEQAAESFASDRTLIEYRRRRDAADNAGLFAHGDVRTSASQFDVPRQTSTTSGQSYRSAALSPEGIAAHAELARWCRKNRLSDEERAHWTQVLLEQPGNREAESRLGLKWFAGGLYTNAQIDSLKQQRAAELKQWHDWKPTVLRWKDMLDSGIASNRDQAAAEMSGVKDPTIIPALEWIDASDSAKPPVTRDGATPFQSEAIALIGRIPEQQATYSLVLHSMLLRQAEARAAAANELKKRPLHDFVPILLAGLANPIQFEWWASFDPTVGLATYRASLSQETEDKIIKIEYSDTMTGLVPAGGNIVAKTTTLVDVAHVSPDLVRSQRARDPTTLPGAKVTSRTTISSDSPRPLRPRGLTSVPGASALASRTASLSESIDEWNAKHEQINARIGEVLKRTTMRTSAGESDDSDEADVIPKSASSKPATVTADFWWDWWASYNETPTPAKQIDIRRYSRESFADPDRYSRTSVQGSTPQMYNSTTGQLVAPPPLPTHSCFAAGTLVATAIGPAPIESIRIGDRVLAQDADTGELAYKPVLGTSKSPPSKLLQVSTTRGAVRLTLGHPFWLEGKGWRMAKELAVGNRIHCLGGSAEVTGIQSQSAEPVYNLNVADFGTYFVGDGQFLVHDFTPRLPTPAVIPGYIADARDRCPSFKNAIDN